VEVTARAAGAADADVVRALAARAAAEVARARDGSLHLRAEHGLADAEPRRQLERPSPALRTLAEIDGVAVGFVEADLVQVDAGRPICRIRALYVEPEAREVGAGEALVEAVCAFATRAGAGGVDAYALPGAREVKNFFESAGFVARLIVMHRPLPER
jgi:GNAT superfamily N-acetyltransferase